MSMLGEVPGQTQTPRTGDWILLRVENQYACGPLIGRWILSEDRPYLLTKEFRKKSRMDDEKLVPDKIRGLRMTSKQALRADRGSFVTFVTVFLLPLPGQWH